ncbi:MAG: exodeoxyribonuclease VII small subunit [Cellvibrionales bacterium TMED21]|jgi:exodeoxyribonuclease VII small subunit|nr:exodeoxyribonuclease VII small subunit [Halieaceae bacterium]OUT67749.1 MAG: exodeoxyribonuclease VII small subunit [Cellvibrionales bacterium TMED21]|tara:strand:+ start:26 stop:253 length:228 start_codon:yes stop_codon:yes gene_type:complete
MSDDQNTEPKKLSQQLDELAALVKALENPDIEIEEAMALYESGMKLAQAAQQALAEAEQRIEVITASSKPSNSDS